MSLSLEIKAGRRSLRRWGCGGNIDLLYWLGRNDPAGVLEQGKCTLGIPRNLGDPVDLRSHSPAGTLQLIKSQACGRGLWHPRERSPRVQERYRHAKETERAGWTREVLAPS